jgi:hypothetical protein
MSGSSLLTRAGDATNEVVERPIDDTPAAPAAALEVPPRGISPRHSPPVRQIARPEAVDGDGRLAEATADGPRPAPRERRWWRMLGGAR